MRCSQLFFLQDGVSTGSVPLVDNQANFDGWKSVQLDPDERGSVELVQRIETYSLAMVGSADIAYPESHDPLFDANENEFLSHVVAENAAVVSVLKVTREGLKRRAESEGRYPDAINVANYFSAHKTNPTETWAAMKERVWIPSELHFHENSTCSNNSDDVTVLVAAYKGYGKFAPLRRNPV